MAKRTRVDRWIQEGREFVLWLQCGHIVRRKQIYDWQEDIYKSAPRMVVCEYCQQYPTKMPKKG